MPTTAIDFINNADFVRVNSEIAASKGKLSLVSTPGLTATQDFASDTGFTYDNTKAEFTGGLVRQKDLRPANATFFASYLSSINASWSASSPTATNSGASYNVSTGRVDLLGGVSQKYITYAADNLLTVGDSGCVRWGYVPGYSGAPATYQAMLSLGNNSLNPNSIRVNHYTSGSIILSIIDSSSAYIMSVVLGSWSPVAGTLYDFEFNWNTATGQTRLFINGTQFGGTQSNVGVIEAPLNTLRFGEGLGLIGAQYYSNFSLDYVVVYSEPQHTANFTVGALPPEYPYAESVVELPALSYAAVVSVTALTSITPVEVDTPKYTIDGKYWNGSAWATSDNTYAQANDAATINTNITTLTPSGLSCAMKIIFQNSTTLASVANFILTFTGQKYYTSGSFLTNSSFTASDIISFETDTIEDSETRVKYAIIVNGVRKYWSGSAWATSDGSAAQTNTLAQIQANIGSLISLSATIHLYVLLVSDTNLATPKISLVTFVYQFGVLPITAPLTCYVYGFVLDMGGAPVAGVTVKISVVEKANQYIEAALQLLNGAQKTTTTDATGFWAMNVIRSSEIEGSKRYALEYGAKSMNGSNKILFEVPDQASANIADLVVDA